MPISILLPQPAPLAAHDVSRLGQQLFDTDSDTEMADDLPRPTKRARGGPMAIVTPGENITDDPQWMRYATYPRPILLPCPRTPLTY